MGAMESPVPAGVSLLPRIEAPQGLVFCDFDGTYLLHDDMPRRTQELAALEAYLETTCPAQGLVFGWVTGSSLETLGSKTLAYGIRLWPHFIAGALGTELWLFSREEGVRRDEAWEQRMVASGFSPEAAARLAQHLRVRGVPLKPQDKHNQGPRKYACYYHMVAPEADRRAMELTRRLAAEAGIAVHFTRCGSGVGDPKNCYDVDFIPMGSGKRAIVRHLLQAWGLPQDRGAGFGDSQNDLDMLDAVGAPFMVANADPGMRGRGYTTLDEPGPAGVLQGLRRLTFGSCRASSEGI